MIESPIVATRRPGSAVDVVDAVDPADAPAGCSATTNPMPTTMPSAPMTAVIVVPVRRITPVCPEGP